MPAFSRPLVALAVVLLTCASLPARPAHKKALADHFGPLLPAHLNDCRTCHLPDQPGQKSEEGEKPHNPFGARLVAVRRDLAKARKSTAIVDRLQAIAVEDSDGDGTPNLLELLAGRNPGEAQDRPTPLELARARRLQTVFVARKPYPWRPFEAVQRPPVPRVKNMAWVRNPIDAFVAEQHELYGLKPRPPAAPEVLLRRVYLDLIGLPPTAEEVETFRQAVARNSQAALEEVVDRLLASPRYGERWGRHWMDVWRYVDGGTSGLQDGWVGAPNMWRWRDWIIDSLNADKGYDRMVQEMLAGDELAPEDPQTLVATAFLARNNNRSRDNWLHDTVNHTTRAFLGVTMECARCHDHMYDPLKQVEYYQLRAIFEPYTMRIDKAPDGSGGKKDRNGLTRVVDERLTTPTYLYIRGVEQNPDKSKVLTPGVPELLGQSGFQVEPVSFTSDGKKRQSSGRRLALARWLTRSENPLTARVAANHIWLRHFGQAIVASTFNFGADGQPPTHPALLDWLAAELMTPSAPLSPRGRGARGEGETRSAKKAEPLPPAPSPKRRGGVDEGLLSPLAPGGRGPGGEGETRSAEDFPSSAPPLRFGEGAGGRGSSAPPLRFGEGAGGRGSSAPPLPSEERGEVRPWSMKHLHRLIVTSSAYQMASTPDTDNSQLDPENRFLWRVPTRRMEAEVVRDSLLAVAGNLDTTMHGPDIDPKKNLDSKRRSVYFRCSDSDFLRFLEFFDPPTVEDCYYRPQSIMPQQALTLLNSDLALAQARHLARELATQTGDNSAHFVQAAFLRVLGRRCTAAEEKTCLDFIGEQKLLFQANAGKLSGSKSGNGQRGASEPMLRAQENLVHLLFNHHEFVTVR